MTPRSTLICTTGLILLMSGRAEAWKSAEEVCAKYKPDRTLSAEASSETAGSASGTGWGVDASASAESASAEKVEQQALSRKELEKQEKVYKACLAHEDGAIEEVQWKTVLNEYLGLSPVPKEKSMKDKIVDAVANQTKPSKKKSAQMKPVPSPCGRYTHLKIHVPSQYTQKSCKDNPPKKGRLVFHSPQGKASTCEHISSWAGINGFVQVSAEKSRAKDTLVLSKSGFPNMTVKCVNTPKDSGKPTRLVFILDR